MTTKFNMHADESSGLLLWQLTNIWQTGIRKLLLKHRLTHPQFVILASTAWILKTQGEVNQKQVSLFTKIDPMTVSVVVRGLLKKWYLTRVGSKTDTRAYLLALTDTGSDTLKKSMDEVDAYDLDFFSKLWKDLPTMRGFMQGLIWNNAQ